MKANNAVEWFKEHGGILTINRSPASKEAREAWGAKYADIVIEQAGTAVTIEQAERYAREFAAEQLNRLIYIPEPNERGDWGEGYNEGWAQFQQQVRVLIAEIERHE